MRAYEETVLKLDIADSRGVVPPWSRLEIEALLSQIRQQRDTIDRTAVALESIMIGGNHLVTIIGADHPPYTATADEALEHYGAGDRYDAWVCWQRIMRAREHMAHG